MILVSPRPTWAKGRNAGLAELHSEALLCN